MNQDQLLSGVRSLLKVVGAILTARGLNNAAGIVNGEDVLGVAMVLAGLIWSHYANKPTTPAA